MNAYSNPVARICGVPDVGGLGYTINRCGHSIMAETSPWRRIASLCTPLTHDVTTQVWRQFPSGGRSILGTTSLWPGWGTVTQTVTECNDGVSTNFAGPDGASAWQSLYNIGSAPIQHPPWSPDNHEFRNFADGTSTVVGHNL